MHAARTVLLTAAAGVASALLAGCGGDSSTRPAGTPKDAAPARQAVVEIRSPPDAKRVRARQTEGGAWLGRVRVSGTTAAGGSVYLRAGCRPRPCLDRARADRQGRWSARLKVRTQPSVRFVTIDAGPDETLAKGSDVITVELYVPGRTVRAQAGPSKPRENRARRPASRALPRDVLVIGDSLAAGFGPALKEELAGWRVRVDARIGRPLDEGMTILARQREAPAILAFSLFTNDSPRDVDELRAAVRATATRSGGCAVWATIVRPPYDGRTYEATNRMLAGLADESQLALGLQIVDWASAVASEGSLLTGDGIHATPAGYATLAKMYARAIRACAGEST